MELKYGINYIEAFAFKHLADFVHYETLDVYKQHFSKILDITKIPNIAYATTIVSTSQATLQATIAHHGIVHNNLDPVLALVKLSLQQFIVATSNILPTIDAPAFVDPVGELFRVLELEFLVKSSEKIL